MRATTFPLLLVSIVNLGMVTARAADQSATQGLYEPNPTRTFGQPNPSAPKELAQFSFLIGDYDCTDELTDLEGKTTQLNARWSGKYILNGYGIQDSYWNESYSTTNVRVYDDAQTQWRVTYFREPGNQSGVWVGGATDSNLVLTRFFEREGRTIESRLTFSNITESGFEWVAEYIAGDARYTHWKSRCQRAAG